MNKTKRRVKSSVPKFILAAQIFGPLYSLLNDMNKGEVNEVEGIVILNKNNAIKEISNLLMSAPRYLRTWCIAFDNISRLTGIELKTVKLKNIADILEEESIELTEVLILEARTELDAMKSMWLNSPKHIIDAGLQLLSDAEAIV